MLCYVTKDGTVHTHWFENIDDVMGDDSPRNQFSKQLCDNYLNDKVLLLDIGCGNGRFLYSLSEPRTVGLELDVDALRIAKQNCPQSEFVLGSSLHLPFRNGSFDHASLLEVIEHVPKGTESLLLSEINRVLKQNGNFTMSTPNNHPLSVILDPAYFLKGHRHYDMKTLNDLLLMHGFDIRKQTIKGGLGMLITMNMFYFFKHVLGRRPFGRIYNSFLSRSKKEYLMDYNGISNCFFAAVKTRDKLS